MAPPRRRHYRTRPFQTNASVTLRKLADQVYQAIAGRRQATTSSKRKTRVAGTTTKPSRSVGLIALLKDPIWMTRPARSCDASAGAARRLS